MSRAVCRLVIGVCVAGLMAASVPPAGAVGPVRPNPFGIGGHKRGVDDALALAEDLGVGWVRIFLRWADIEPRKGTFRWDQAVLGPDNADWSKDAPDDLIHDAYAHGLSILVVLNGIAPWAGGGAGENHRVRDFTCGPDEDLNCFANFAREACLRYRDKVAAWELFNEPNRQKHWAGTIRQYRDVILKPAAHQIKLCDPHALVAAPALGRGGNNVNQQFWKWLKESSGRTPRGPDDGALAADIDVVTFHQYGTVAEITDSIASANTFAARHSGNGMELETWITEFGWSDNALTPDCNNTAPDPGRKVCRIFGAVGNPAWPRFTRAFVFNLTDRIGAFPRCRYGLLNEHGVTTERYHAVRDFLQRR